MVLAQDAYKEKKFGKVDNLDHTVCEYTNMSMAAIIYSHIKEYSNYHSGPLIANAVIKSVKKEVPGIEDFLESRFREVNFTKEV